MEIFFTEKYVCGQPVGLPDVYFFSPNQLGLQINKNWLVVFQLNYFWSLNKRLTDVCLGWSVHPIIEPNQTFKHYSEPAITKCLPLSIICKMLHKLN